MRYFATLSMTSTLRNLGIGGVGWDMRPIFLAFYYQLFVSSKPELKTLNLKTFPFCSKLSHLGFAFSFYIYTTKI